jgi:hypothetical protein
MAMSEFNNNLELSVNNPAHFFWIKREHASFQQAGIFKA